MDGLHVGHVERLTGCIGKVSCGHDVQHIKCCMQQTLRPPYLSYWAVKVMLKKNCRVWKGLKLIVFFQIPFNNVSYGCRNTSMSLRWNLYCSFYPTNAAFWWVQASRQHLLDGTGETTEQPRQWNKICTMICCYIYVILMVGLRQRAPFFKLAVATVVLCSRREALRWWTQEHTYSVAENPTKVHKEIHCPAVTIMSHVN